LNDKETTNQFDALNYHDNAEMFLIVEMWHPTFVYGAKFHPK